MTVEGPRTPHPLFRDSVLAFPAAREDEREDRYQELDEPVFHVRKYGRAPAAVFVPVQG
jgi:hypothetical protein